MQKIKIDIDKKSYNFTHPDNFSELSIVQYIEIVRLVLLSDIPLQDRYDDRIRLFVSLLSGKKRLKHKIIKTLINNPEDDRFLQLLKLHDFVIKEIDFNNWLVKDIRIKRVRLYGPTDRFSDMKFGDFIACDMLLNGFFKSNKNEKILNDFVAYVMRPKRKGIKKNETGDKRKELNSNTVLARSKIIDKLAVEIKYAVLFNFLAVRRWIEKKYPYVFPNSENANTQNNDFGATNKSGWMMVRRQLAASVLNLQKIDNTGIHDVLADFNEKLIGK